MAVLTSSGVLDMMLEMMIYNDWGLWSIGVLLLQISLDMQERGAEGRGGEVWGVMWVCLFWFE